LSGLRKRQIDDKTCEGGIKPTAARNMGKAQLLDDGCSRVAECLKICRAFGILCNEHAAKPLDIGVASPSVALG
jgi:hypothetical protein